MKRKSTYCGDDPVNEHPLEYVLLVDLELEVCEGRKILVLGPVKFHVASVPNVVLHSV
jgi:hypothetical protein